MLAICRLHVVFELDAQRDASWRSKGLTAVVFAQAHGLVEPDLDRHYPVQCGLSASAAVTARAGPLSSRRPGARAPLQRLCSLTT